MKMQWNKTERTQMINERHKWMKRQPMEGKWNEMSHKINANEINGYWNVREKEFIIIIEIKEMHHKSQMTTTDWPLNAMHKC